jgi:tripartite-type tricarboxylate transporter receptor subunit TctC
MSSRRHFLLASAAALTAHRVLAQGQSFPAKPIRVVVPFGAGGVADLTARTVGQRLGEILGQSIVIENKPGAGGVVAADTVAKAEPDGHTLLLMSNGNAVSVNLFNSLPYDTVKDFTPVAVLGTFDLIVVVPAESKFKTLADLVKFGKANPGKLNIGSINIGSTQNLSAELLKTTAGIAVQVVPFNGTPAVLTALRGGQIDAAVEVLSPVLPHIKSGTLRALATTGPARSAALPEVPTAKEAGTPLLATSWNALAAPSHTPKAVVDKLNAAINQALADTGTRARLYAQNVTAQGGSSEQAKALLASDIKRWGDVIQRAGIAKQ